jgi:hypothetical protein
MAEVKNQAMALGNRAFVEGVGRQQIEKRIGLRASIRDSREQIGEKIRRDSGSCHEVTSAGRLVIVPQPAVSGQHI